MTGRHGSVLGKGIRRPELIVLAVTVAVATTLPIVAAVSALRDVRSTAESSLMMVSSMAAMQADRLLIEQFFELELLAASVGDESDMDANPLLRSLRTVYGRLATLSSGVVWFGENGDVVFAEPESSTHLGANADRIRSGVAADGRSVSMPYLSPTTGHVEVALSVPVYRNDGSRQGTLVGLLDLTEPLVTDLVEPARILGSTGHADLVDERGLVLASTNPSHVLKVGDHPELYDAVARDRVPIVERVPHDADASSLDQSAWHVMAYAPLRIAPWGIAMGASEAEVYEPVSRLRTRFIAIGAASLVTLLAGGVLALGLARRTDRSDDHIY
ncbi:MAG: cache domain-containing protein [Acidobacteria bacterium]|nr:cache domain-containing protein [Acidobacteriota bacterium]